MNDTHVHIGQFEDVYYDPLEVTDIVMSAGIKSMSFSSTSSCIGDIRYTVIEREILELLSCVSYSDEIIKPFCWFIPDYITQNISVERAFASVPYKGIKIHPYIQHWDFNDSSHMDTLHSLFDYSARNDVPVLIHTGHSGVDNAKMFEYFISEYKSAKCILAHCRPLDSTIEMLRKYYNVYCDTAFVPSIDIQQIISCGFSDRILLGSDFPITHFFKIKYPNSKDDPDVTMKDQYSEDIAEWKLLELDLTHAL